MKRIWLVFALVLATLLSGCGLSYAGSGDGVPYDLAAGWNNFQDKIKEAEKEVDATECQKGNLPYSVAGATRVYNNELKLIGAIVYKTGPRRFIELYSQSADGLSDKNLDIEVDRFRKRYTMFCRKALEWDESGLLFTKEQDEFDPSEKEKKIVEEFNDEFALLAAPMIKLWQDADPMLFYASATPTEINGEKSVMVLTRVGDSSGYISYFPVARYPMSGLKSFFDIKLAAEDAVKKISAALKDKSFPEWPPM